MGAVLSAQMCLDAGHKLLNNKGLVDIIIRPHLKADREYPAYGSWPLQRGWGRRLDRAPYGIALAHPFPAS